jgi:nucleoside-diphosphate-sugar epimerase
LKILITGGCGYVGSSLVLELSKSGHHITVIDAGWFGNFLPELSNVKIEKKLYSDLSIGDIEGSEIVIHLANVANDPSVELNPTMSWEINVLHHTQLLENCRRTKSVKKFIYASSGSVYGIKQEHRVTEDLLPLPISVYNKTKMVAERVALSYSDDFSVIVVRPATVCGISPRMRFDVVVNMFVLQAYNSKEIQVLGGDQIRPNIHMKDMVRVYEHAIENDLPPGVYNSGFENISVREIANKVSILSGAKIIWKDSNDPRSYRQDSSKLIETGFVQLYGVDDAISEIWQALESKEVVDQPEWHTVKWMVKNQIHLGAKSGN